jgi:hypothetical protein
MEHTRIKQASQNIRKADVGLEIQAAQERVLAGGRGGRGGRVGVRGIVHGLFFGRIHVSQIGGHSKQSTKLSAFDSRAALFSDHCRQTQVVGNFSVFLELPRKEQGTTSETEKLRTRSPTRYL